MYNDCDGRCLDGDIFGPGFDSPQVHITEFFLCEKAENGIIRYLPFCFIAIDFSLCVMLCLPWLDT